MKKKLLTIVTPEISKYARGFVENQRQYAGSNGYEHVTITTVFWTRLHPSFSKVNAIKTALDEGCDIVLWADADVAFMDHNKDLADLLIDDYFMAAYHQSNWPNWVYLCAGLTVWKNTPEAKRFVNEWWRRCDAGYIEHNPWEQWYMDEMVREANYKGIRACSAHEIGCFCPQTWHDGTIWKPGMPTIHMAGQATWSQRSRVLQETYLGQVKRKS